MHYRVTIAGMSRDLLDAAAVAALAPRFAEQRGELHSDGISAFVATFEVRVEGIDPLDALVNARRWLRTIIATTTINHLEVVRVGYGPGRDNGDPDLVGVAEVAEMLGITKQAVAKRSTPAPIVRLKAGPVWRRTDWT